jgi:hypothetical protein
MPATRGPHDTPTGIAGTPPSTPHGGAWTQSGDGQWTWTPQATPDPGLVSQWGLGSLTDIRQDPTGIRNHGAWTPGHGGGWSWTWGASPDPHLADNWGTDTLTNPDRSPNDVDTSAENTPPPPDAQPPTVTDTWNGVPPDITGTVTPTPAGGGSQAVSEPPQHHPYLVSPGGIRNAETVLLAQVDAAIGNYNSLRDYVTMSQGQNLYANGAGYGQIVAPEHNLLLQIGDVLEMAGQFCLMLNNAAQSYAKADLDSFLPQD